METNQNLLRADIALAALASNGGLLQPEQANAFIDMVTEQPTLLNQIRVERMAGPQKKINKLGIASRIMRAASQTGTQEDNATNGRYLAKAKRSSPVTSQIQLQTQEHIAEVRIPYEVFEDNIEGQSFEAHVLRQIAERAALDFEEFCLFSDTASADPDLALHDGWLKRLNSHVIDNVNAGPSDTLITNALLALPQKYLRNLPQMRAYISQANRIKFQASRIARNTALGDASTTGNLQVVSQGLVVEPANTLAADGTGKKGLVTFPKNLIWGIQRNISVETDKDIRSREYIVVVTARTAIQIEDIEAGVKLINI